MLDLEISDRSFLKWFWILTDAISIAFFSAKFPRVIIVDLKILKVGDMDYFLKLMKPRVVVFSDIGGEFRDEYLKLADALPEKGMVLFNRDDEVQKDVGFLNTRVKYYSLDKAGELEQIVADFVGGKYVY
jgi:hypothetical protein